MKAESHKRNQPTPLPRDQAIREAQTYALQPRGGRPTPPVTLPHVTLVDGPKEGDHAKQTKRKAETKQAEA